MGEQLRFPATEQEKADLIADLHRRAGTGLKKVERMHHLYGLTPGRTCGECDHILRRVLSRDYLKCELYGNTGGPGTDWRVKWPACGKFSES